MKKLMFIIIVFSILLFAGCSSNTKKITNFEECENAGYPIMESYPEQCSDGTNTFTKIIPMPPEGEDNPRICTMEYMPVCGIDGITYGNKCAAGDVEIAYQGECILK